MQQSTPLPQLTFLVRLQTTKSNAADTARVQHLAHLFRGHGVQSTWIIAGCGAAQLLQDRGLLNPQDDLALEIAAESCAADVSADSFRAHLRKSLTAIFKCTENNLSLIAGNPLHLRPRTAVLAERGIRGVISTVRDRPPTAMPKLLPSGLWQLQASVEIPQTSLLRGWLPANRHVASKILTPDSPGRLSVLLVDVARFARASSRTIQGFDSLLRQCSLAASSGKLEVITAGDAVAQLAQRRKTKPQQSILRAA